MSRREMLPLLVIDKGRTTIQRLEQIIQKKVKGKRKKDNRLVFDLLA
jgi:hypothetical protein